jgi:hypothetical protein
MAKQPAPTKLIIAVGAVALLAYLVYASFQQTHLKYEVCMNFKGATHCSTATGSNSDEAIHSARQIDCQLLTNGRDELMVCMDLQPSSITQLK